jgi:hypothetical protein
VFGRNDKSDHSNLSCLAGMTRIERRVITVDLSCLAGMTRMITVDLSCLAENDKKY